MDRGKKFVLFGFASAIAHAIVLVALGTLFNNNKEILVSSLNSYKPLLVTVNSGKKNTSPEKQQASNPTTPVPQAATTDNSVASPPAPLPDLKTNATASNTDKSAEERQRQPQESTLLTLIENKNIGEQDSVALVQHYPDVINIETKNAMIHEKLNALVQRNFRYPGFAVKRGWEGTVKLGLRIEANGRLSHVRVIKTSGHSILDQAALTTLSQTNYIYGLEDWLAGNYFDTTLPVQYQLIDG